MIDELTRTNTGGAGHHAGKRATLKGSKINTGPIIDRDWSFANRQLILPCYSLMYQTSDLRPKE